jgi:formylglycine-generating enzyme required for sulfatase activity
MFATRSGKVALENVNGRNSYFTQELLKYLETPNLTLNQIFKATRQSLQQVTTQFKEPQVPGCVDELDNEMVLIQKSGYVPPPPPPEKTAYFDLPFAEMAYVEGGTFQMGDTRNEGFDSEKPVHTVTVSSFLMGKYEVTQRQWESVMDSNPSAFKNCPDCPVEMVSWDDIQVFLQKLNTRTGGNYRLPTEAEWEYAAGGGNTPNRTRFGNGQNVLDPSQVNFDASASHKAAYSVAGESHPKTVAVGRFAPNSLGLYNLSGNVGEWCADWYGGYSNNAQTNPTGPATPQTYRVLRGGSWGLNPEFCRSAFRLYSPPKTRDYRIGFRIVSPAQ